MPTPIQHSTYIPLTESPWTSLWLRTLHLLCRPHCAVYLVDSQGVGGKQVSRRYSSVLVARTHNDNLWWEMRFSATSERLGNWWWKSQIAAMFWAEKMLRTPPLQTAPLKSWQQWACSYSLFAFFLPTDCEQSELYSAYLCIPSQWQSPWHRPNGQWISTGWRDKCRER